MLLEPPTLTAKLLPGGHVEWHLDMVHARVAQYSNLHISYIYGIFPFEEYSPITGELAFPGGGGGGSNGLDAFDAYPDRENVFDPLHEVENDRLPADIKPGRYSIQVHITLNVRFGVDEPLNVRGKRDSRRISIDRKYDLKAMFDVRLPAAH